MRNRSIRTWLSAAWDRELEPWVEWQRQRRQLSRSDGHTNEDEQKLRALGYVGH